MVGDTGVLPFTGLAGAGCGAASVSRALSEGRARETILWAPAWGAALPVAAAGGRAERPTVGARRFACPRGQVVRAATLFDRAGRSDALEKVEQRDEE